MKSHKGIPFNNSWTFENPKPSHRYVQVLKAIATWPKMKRYQIINLVWHKRFTSNKEINGFVSSLFTSMIWNGLIEYDNDYAYQVTDNGYAILDKAWK